MSGESRAYRSNNVARWTWETFMAEARENTLNDLGGGYRSCYMKSQGHDWDGGLDYHDTISRATNGDPTLLGKANEISKNLEIQSAEGIAFKTVMGIAGGQVCVPAALINHPECMFSRQRRPRETRQVSIYVCNNSSASINAKLLLNRGCAILTLLESLQVQQITVDLYIVGVLGVGQPALDGGPTCEYSVIELPCRPLDLSTLGFAIAHPAFDRHLCHAALSKLGFTGGWARNKTPDYVRKVLGMQPQDIYIPETYGTDDVCMNPQKWLNEKINQIT